MAGGGAALKRKAFAKRTFGVRFKSARSSLQLKWTWGYWWIGTVLHMQLPSNAYSQDCLSTGRNRQVESIKSRADNETHDQEQEEGETRLQNETGNARHDVISLKSQRKVHARPSLSWFTLSSHLSSSIIRQTLLLYKLILMCNRDMCTPAV